MAKDMGEIKQGSLADQRPSAVSLDAPNFFRVPHVPLLNYKVDKLTGYVDTELTDTAPKVEE